MKHPFVISHVKFNDTFTYSLSDSFLLHHNPPGQTIIGTLMALLIVVTLLIGVFLFIRQRRHKGSIDIVRKIGWAYALMFFLTSALTYIPGLADDSGNFLGLFRLDLVDDLLHYFSGLWVMLASYTSFRQTTLYFKIFGSIYLLDAVVGYITQRGVLDGGLWLYEHPQLDMIPNILANMPHTLIGGFAVFVGFVLASKVKLNEKKA